MNAVLPRGPRRPSIAWIAGAVLLGGAVVGLVLLTRGLLAVRAVARDARRAVAAGRCDQARAALDRWLRARPDSAEAHFLRARCAFATGQPQQAIESLDRARALGYPERPVERLRAFTLVLSRRYAEAEPILVRLLGASIEPDPEADEALARVLLQTYQLRRAAVVLQRWMRDAPHDPRPHLWHTEIDRRTSADPSTLIDHYRAALRLDPTLDAARLGLADALREAHREVEAAVEYATYLARKPDDPAGHVGAGRNALQQGDLAAAATHLDHALVLAPAHATALKERAAVAQRRGEHEAALGFLDRALKVDPHDREAWHQKGLVLARLGRHDEAMAAQETTARLRRDEAELNSVRARLVRSPDDHDLQLQIARWMFEHGQDEEGLRWTRTILQREPGHGPTHRLLAGYHQRRGNAGLANYHRLQAESVAKARP